MEQYRLKVKDLHEIKKETDQLKAMGKKVVFTNGCFDLLHPGHARYLWAAKQLGDFLVVAVNSDRSVQAIKAKGRPIVPERERAEMVAALQCVDGVVIFDEDAPLGVIEHLLPDVLVKGGDWQEGEIVGSDVVKQAGGEIQRIPFVAGYSTTIIIKKISDLFYR
jgi:D-beta-D-heptose 7-phosphate kinase/D-beta-D-heptose 1-phosphate adenosyltransferase